MKSGYGVTDAEAGPQGEHQGTPEAEMGIVLHKAKDTQDCQQPSQWKGETPEPDFLSTATKAMLSADTST